jgi:hypothetical protein
VQHGADGCRDAPFAATCCTAGFECARASAFFWQCTPTAARDNPRRLLMRLL